MIAHLLRGPRHDERMELPDNKFPPQIYYIDNPGPAPSNILMAPDCPIEVPGQEIHTYSFLKQVLVNGPFGKPQTVRYYTYDEVASG